MSSVNPASIRKVKGVCPHDCPDSCSVITEVADGRAVDFYADPDHPITQGWLCAKVRPYLNHVYHPDRLTTPLRRTGPKGSGQYVAISWGEALDEIATRWQAIIAKYGGEAILPYSYSGTLGLVQMTVASHRLWNRMGASQLDRAICGEAAAFAVNQTLGRRLNARYETLADSQMIVCWGHNPVSTAPHCMPFIRQAQRNGAQLVVIDPRRTRTARGADWHIQPLPGTDSALALGIAHVILRDELQDEAWLAQHTLGWPDLQTRLADYPLERVAAITGVPAATIEAFARRYATTTPAMIKISDGLQRHRNGGQTVRAILMLPAMTGQYGQRGGGLSYSSSGTLMWDGNALSHWSECPPLGRVVNMNRLGAALTGEATDPPIQSLYVFGANPAAVSPNAGLIVKGLMRDDLFTVVHELFMTDTADYADIILPATSQLEQKDLHKPYGNGILAYNEQAIAPLGKSKSNWDVMRLLAARMGYTEPWLQQDVDEVIDEVLTASAKRYPVIAGATVASINANGGTWTLTEIDDIPFADTVFPTPSGKVELRIDRFAKLGLDPLPIYIPLDDDGGVAAAIGSGYPAAWTPETALNLLTGAPHHFVTSSLANQPDLRAREGEPFVEINPADAAARGIEDGMQVEVANGRGSVWLKAVVTEAIRPGVLSSPKGMWSKHHKTGRNVNWTTSDALGDMAGQSTFHTNRVWLRVAE